MVNAGKYFATIILIVVTYFKNTFRISNTVYVEVAVFATLYSYTWDIIMDWGLLRGTMPGKKLLRDRLKFPKSFYYFAMITNLILRFSWVFTLIPLEYLPRTIQEFDGVFIFLAFAEAYRRAQWSLFRVENENVNNFEKYRAIMEIPKLPDDNNTTTN